MNGVHVSNGMFENEFAGVVSQVWLAIARRKAVDVTVSQLELEELADARGEVIRQ